MKIKMQEIPIRDLIGPIKWKQHPDGNRSIESCSYVNSDEDGVYAYDSKLNIRPKFQREFVYKDKQRDEVIRTVTAGFPLNVMYWAKNPDGSYELMDGQQRTISICEYVVGNFSLDFRAFHNLTPDEQDAILDYKLTVYICEGSEAEKLAWFKVINIAGEKLTVQELRNAVYSGAWVTAAKRRFAKTGCTAVKVAEHGSGKGSVCLMSGTPIRQDYLETVLSWAADRDGIKSIEEYMSQHQNDADAEALWDYFDSVMRWVKYAFPVPRKEMSGVEWGLLYNKYKHEPLNPDALEERVAVLMLDDDVTKKAGIYAYVLTGEEKHLSIRAFTPKMKREAYERQQGVCPKCGEHFELSEMEADHVTPWSQGGKTVAANCQMLCKTCNRRKSDV